MNELQQRELQMLKEIIGICDRLGIRYYLVCGSALGAAKYQGFIPWDDDMDVGLLRKDYERFIREAPKLLPDWAFLQNYHSDPAFPHIFSKLRDSRTTCIERGLEKLSMNHGVYVDIFPLDGYPERNVEIKLFEFCNKVIRRLITYARKFDSRAHQKGKASQHTAYFLQMLERLFRKYPTENSTIICNHGNWQKELEYAHRSQYGSGTRAKFEGLDVVIPERYDEYLTQKYGDWRSDPPKDKQKSHHEFLMLDLNKPYTDYMNHDL